MKELIAAVVDEGYFYEVQPEFAPQYSHRLCPPRRPLGGHRRQSAGAVWRAVWISTRR